MKIENTFSFGFEGLHFNKYMKTENKQKAIKEMQLSFNNLLRNIMLFLTDLKIFYFIYLFLFIYFILFFF